MGGGHGHGHEFDREKFESPREPSFFDSFGTPLIYGILDKPVTWFRENIVKRIRIAPYPYYHKRFPRVPTIDECGIDDVVCYAEANEQFMRDKMVDANIVRILRHRQTECIQWYKQEREDIDSHCSKIIEDYEDAATNYFIKYGDLGFEGDVLQAYMKQKHRMLFERRHGEVGAGSQAAEGDAQAKKDSSLLSVLRQSFGRASMPKELR